MSTLAFLAVPLGQLLASALACGINLYATVATLALVSRYDLFGWTLPMDLRGLENGVVIASAAMLYVLEFFVDKVPYLDSAWDVVHTIVRPLAAAGLVALALADMPLNIQLAGAGVAAAFAFLSHATKAGVRVVVNRRRRAGVNIAISILEDLIAVSIALAALIEPTAAIAIAGAVLLLLLVVGPIVWRAAALGMRALAARLRGFFGGAAWRTRAELPWRLRRLVDEEPLGRRAPVTARAGLRARGGLSGYRNGWLVFDDDRRLFVYHGFLGPRRLELRAPSSIIVTPGVLADLLDVRGDGSPLYQVFLLKDGPAADRVVAELRTRRS
jgi:hypothetical protein